MQCPNCGNIMNENQKFCGKCGNEVIVMKETANVHLCPNCSNVIRQGAAFCGRCGTNINWEEDRAEYILCPVCGRKLKKDAQFCGRCGKALNQAYALSGNNNLEPKKKKTDGVVVLLVILLILVLAGSAGLIGYMYTMGNDDEVTQVEQEKKSNSKKDADDDEETKTPSKKPSKKPEQPSDEAPEEVYLFPSDREYLTEADLNGKSKEEVAMIRNEIYARHGYIFNTEPYKTYFSEKDWYIPNPSFTVEMLNAVETANKDFLVAYEEAKGWR